MGERGPLPQPDNVRQLRGETRPSRQIGAKQVQPVKGAPECPSSLKGEARAEWKRVVPELTRLGLLAHIDRGKLVNYCRAWAAYCLRAAEVEKYPGEVPQKVWQQFRDSSTLVDSLGAKLYLSPGDRARVKAPEVTEDTSDLD
jgi:P27 family predicted phage terminase small subunit